MKPPHRTAAKPVIYLLAEDVTGFHVMQAIIREKRINATIKLRGQAQGLSILANEVEELIQLTLVEKNPEDCIVILHDTDDSVQTYREHYEKIERICDNKYKGRVTRLAATQEIEAWLLADEGLCTWLGIKAQPSDHLKRPSDHLKTHVKKRAGNWKWDKRHQPKILLNIDATGDKSGGSLSMQSAMKKLATLPCFQPETR
jgi:hypothetical protein